MTAANGPNRDLLKGVAVHDLRGMLRKQPCWLSKSERPFEWYTLETKYQGVYQSGLRRALSLLGSFLFYRIKEDPKNCRTVVVECNFLREKKMKCQQHLVFPGGHPSKYWRGSMLLNFGDRTRTGVFSMIWPLTREVRADQRFHSLVTVSSFWRQEMALVLTHSHDGRWQRGIFPYRLVLPSSLSDDILAKRSFKVVGPCSFVRPRGP